MKYCGKKIKELERKMEKPELVEFNSPKSRELGYPTKIGFFVSKVKKVRG